jgi:DNA helicase II / ATP-dependent DNA helicase PcrA
MRERHEIRLSDEQREARDAEDRYLLVLASAGSGKTEVVAQRVERILADQSGFRVLALSYTRRAATELRDRFAARLGDSSRRAEADTIHGFAQGLLLQYGTWLGLPATPALVVDDADRVELLQAWRAEAGMPPLQDAREQLLRLDAARARGFDDPLAEDWDTALADSGALDYGSMLSRAAELLQVPAVGGVVARLYRHVVVDEAQNLTASQFQLLRRLLHLSADTTSAMFVGDDKQSIVGFAGASPDHMHAFAHEFSARTIRLSQNFRSATKIVRLGDEIARAMGDPTSQAQTYAAAGQVTCVEMDDEQAEARAVRTWVEGLLADGLPEEALAPGEDRSVRDREVAVLGRTAASLRSCESVFAEAGIPVSRATHADDWLGSETAKAAWLLATYRPDSDVSVRRLRRQLDVDPGTWNSIKQSLRGEDADILREFAQPMTPLEFVSRVRSHTELNDADWAQDQDEIGFVWRSFCDQVPVADRNWSRFELYVARWQRGDELETGVRLHTVHKAQGREYRAVAVVGLNDGQFPDFRARNPSEREAELRAFYVAVTRPSRMLLLSRPRTVQTRRGTWQRDPSPFLAYARANSATS